jgi:hypothetical protein
VFQDTFGPKKLSFNDNTIDKSQTPSYNAQYFKIRELILQSKLDSQDDDIDV